MRFRILKYLPPENRTPARARRARGPALTQDNAFWFEGARAHRLLHPALHVVRHAASPAAAGVRRSAARSSGTASSRAGKGTLYSYVVVHYPQVPSFEYPLPIGLVELEEGTRVVANLGGVEPDDIEIGMAMQAEFVDHDEELSLPVFVPARSRCRRRDHGSDLMDFTFDREQLAVSEAATGCSAGLVDPERVAAVEATDERVDRELWQALAGADLLGLAVPEADGRRRLRPHGAVPVARGAGQRGGPGAAVVHPGAGRAPPGPLRFGGPAGALAARRGRRAT